MPANRLDRFRLRLPACDHFVRPCVGTDLSASLATASGGSISLPVPFFWFDPPWHLAHVDRCRDVARAFAACGVVVSALHRDLTQQDDSDASSFLPRLAPHRCDRAGWTFRDFENASIIDLRLVPTRDDNGRFAYSATQLRRWGNVDDDRSQDLADSIDAMTFPPDWKNIDGMCSKVVQLRRLSDAAIFVSIDEVHQALMLPVAEMADVDGVIIRAEGDPLETIVGAKHQLDQWKRTRTRPLWIATSEQLSAEDCVKCFAMGASALSVDLMCNETLFDDQSRYEIAADQVVAELAEAVRGYTNSCGVAHVADLRPEHLTRPVIRQG